MVSSSNWTPSSPSASSSPLATVPSRSRAPTNHLMIHTSEIIRDFLSNIGLRTDEKIWHCYIFPDLPEIWYFQFTLEGNGFNWTQRSVSCSNTFKTLNGRSLTSDFQLFLAIKKHLFWGRQRGQVLCNAMHLPIWIPVSESFVKCRIRSAKVCFNKKSKVRTCVNEKKR